MGGNAALVINPNLMDKLGYDPLKDFTYITQVFIVPNLVVVPPDVPAKTIQELIALAKAKPDYFVAGHAGIGTSQHLGGELFMTMTGVKLQQVPYRGTTQILPDLLGGRLNIFFGNISNVLPLVREGKLRAFAHHLAQALAADSRPADHGGAGLSGLRGHRLVRPDGAGRHAEADRRQAARRDRRRCWRCRTCAASSKASAFSSSATRPRNSPTIVKTEMPMWGKVIKDAGIKMPQ